MNNKKVLSEVQKINSNLRKRVRKEEALLKRIKKIASENESLSLRLSNAISTFHDYPSNIPVLTEGR